METLGLLVNIMSVARGIHTWLDEVQSKKEKIQLLQLRVNRLIKILSAVDPSLSQEYHPKSKLFSHKQNISKPTSLGPAAPSPELCLDLAQILSKIRTHLSLYRAGSSPTAKLTLGNLLDFINPSVLLNKLADDDTRLSQWIELYSLHLHIINTQALTASILGGSVLETEDLEIETLTDNKEGELVNSSSDAEDFWNICVGKEVDMVTPTEFLSGLRCWTRQDLCEFTCASLLLSLDPDDVGSVVRKSFLLEVGSMSLQNYINKPSETERGQMDKLESFSDDEATIVNDKVPQEAHERGGSNSRRSESEWPLLPTLVWIDDRIENNKRELKYAESLGIRVITIPSTSIAKLWIQKNEECLRSLQSNGCLGFITDNTRWEGTHTQASFLNMSAGECILRFLRGNHFASPVLVYCGQSIAFTGYVKLYSQAASTSQTETCRLFIAALSKSLSGGRNGSDDFDQKWEKAASVRRGWNIRLVN